MAERDDGPTGDIYVLTGPPGVGKYTVASAMAALLEARGQTVRVVDNHYTCNPVFGLVAHDGVTPLASQVWDRVAEVREAIARTIEGLSPAHWTFIFTHVVDRSVDEEWVERLARVSEARSARFVVVRVQCDLDELLRRVVVPSRRERMKSVSAEDARRSSVRGVQALEKWNPMIIDVTYRSPVESAEIILQRS